MQKKSKTIFTAVVTALFVLSVSYFALLAPTTAWFYEEDYTTANYQFEFGNFNMSESLQSAANATIPLRAATRFADAGELLFDEVVHVVKVDVSNTGALKGQVKVDVRKQNDNAPDLPSWLKWCVCTTSSASGVTLPTASANTLKITNTSAYNLQMTLKLTVEDENGQSISFGGAAAQNVSQGDHTQTFTLNSGATYAVSGLDDNAFVLATSSTENVRFVNASAKTYSGRVPAAGLCVEITGNTYKEAVESVLTSNSVTPTDYTTFASDADYETFNASALSALNANNAAPISVEAGDSTVVCVVFWAEYGLLAGQNVAPSGDPAVRFDAATVAKTLGDYPVTIEFTATPYSSGTQEISVTNTTSSMYDVKLYIDDVLLTDSPANAQGEIAIAAGATVRISQPVGTRFRLEIDSASGSAHLANGTGGIGTVSGAHDHVVTDTVSSHGNAYSIVATQQSQGN